MDVLTKAVSLFMGGKQVLKELDLSINDKEFIGIIGPNGSGKSTLLKCLYRVMKPSAGEILINGKDIEAYSYKESALNMSVVAQHNYYSFDFTVLEVVLMGRSPHKSFLEHDNGEDYKIARLALEKVGLRDFEQRNFSTLSGGEQQRVILARALTQETECLILDEPTNHLDIKYQLDIMNLVKQLNLTVISAIHDLNIAAMYCDRLIALKDGQIVGIGSPNNLLTEDFIKKIYEVETKVQIVDKDRINIIYMSQKK